MSGLKDCKVVGCERLATRKSACLCEMHYYRVRRTGSTETSKRKCDTSVFANPSSSVAWLLGLIWSDGCIRGNRVSLSSVDKDLIDEACRVFGGCTSHIRPKGERAFELGYSDQKMVNDLHRLGLTEAKSLTCKWPVGLERNLYRHFVRGVFDGDGSAVIHRVKKQSDPILTLYVCTASPQFAEDLSSVLLSQGIRAKKYVSTSGNINPVWYVHAGNRGVVEEMARFMYDEGGPCLDRKKRRIAEWLSAPRTPPGNPRLVGREKKFPVKIDRWVQDYLLRSATQID